MTTTNTVATEGGHWYSATDGAPCYTIKGANGSERGTTLRDARKLGLYPSVTTITGTAAKPALTNWLVDQALMAAMTLPRLDGESDSAFMARAKHDGQEQARKARDNGTAIHGSMELAIQGKSYDADHKAHVVATIQSCADSSIDLLAGEAERSFAHPLGFGGKCDWHSREQNIVLDFKTKDRIPEDGKRLIWDDHAMQLAAYREGFGMPTARCFNVFIGVQDRRVIVCPHDEDDIRQGWLQFQALLQFWQHSKRYYPSKIAEAA